MKAAKARDTNAQPVEFNILFNPFKPEYTIVIFIHYKPSISIAIHRNSRLVVDEDDLKWVANEKKALLLRQLQRIVFILKPLHVGN